MTQHSLINVSLICFSLLTLLVSLGEIAVSAISRARLDEKSNPKDNLFEYTPSYSQLPFPSHVQYVPGPVYKFSSTSSAEIAAGVLGLVAAVLALVFASAPFFRKVRSNSSLFISASVYMALAAIINFALLGWMFAKVNQDDARIYPQPRGVMEISWKGSLTHETYTCSLAPYLKSYMGGDWFVSTCALNKAARYMLIPLAILQLCTAALSIAASLLQRRDVKRVATGKV